MTVSTNAVSTEELLQKLESISLCQVSDALGTSCAIETGIRPIDPQSRICGPAKTVLCQPGENITIHYAMHLAQRGDILVVSGSQDCGLWGELMSTAGQERGFKGTILDGAARDPEEIRAMGYPVFARCIHPRKALKDPRGQVDIPIRCGSLLVSPGDIVFADANGIIAFPAGHLAEVVRMALKVAEREEQVKRQIHSGRTTFEILQGAGNQTR
jgi:4-hydroxy-4-methyl-2-oxoglutarate aldolase